MAPDVLVALGRPEGDRGSYRQWVEGGIAPQVVFEVHSPNNTPAEMARKLRDYDRYGVREYYYYEPETGKLSGWQRGGDGGRLRRIARMNGFRSPLLGIRFENGAGREALTIFGPDGKPFLPPLRSAEQRDAALEQVRAEREKTQAERDRADRLAAKLRELGIDPD